MHWSIIVSKIIVPEAMWPDRMPMSQANKTTAIGTALILVGKISRPNVHPLKIGIYLEAWQLCGVNEGDSIIPKTRGLKPQSLQVTGL